VKKPIEAAAGLRWGILGAGRIADSFARAFADVETGRLVAVASRRLESATTFAAKFPGVRAVEGYTALLEDPEVDAVYIATPHPMHPQWAIRAASCGKHILCEKPLALNHADASAVALAAAEHGVFLMEAFMYRCHPQTARVTEIIRSGALGSIRHVRASFGFAATFSAESRLFSNELGGGGMLDVGCYPVSFARLVAGAEAGLPFLDPNRVAGAAKLHPESGVDAFAAAVLEFPNGMLAEVSCAICQRLDNKVIITGNLGSLEIPEPWIPAKEGGTTTMILRLHGTEPETITVDAPKMLYSYEIDVVGRAVQAGRTASEEMSIEDTLGNMQALDAWRQEGGLVYDCEKEEAPHLPVGDFSLWAPGRPLIPSAPLPGLDLPVSRLVMGCDNQDSLSSGAVIWDAFIDRGGNTFDTAQVYGPARETLLGRWLAKRGIRDQVVLMVKGAHTPNCNPYSMKEQLEGSLDRLGTNYADLYFLHRDNPEIPVGEFVDALDALRQAGVIRAYGGSNWSVERLAAANAYALHNGRAPFVAASNNFSLARMVAPVWDGCISSAEDATRQWHEQTPFPLFAWSSQARGFFVDRPADRSQIRCWHSPENFERRERACLLARALGVSPVNVAAAYVLAQSFPVFALIGPRTLSELSSSLGVIGLQLTAAQCAWLDLRGKKPPDLW